MGHLLGRGSIKPKEFGAVVGLMGFEHGVESVQEFGGEKVSGRKGVRGKGVRYLFSSGTMR